MTWKRWLVIVGRVLFLGAAFGFLVWRLGGDADGALDAIRTIGVPSVLGSFLAAFVGMGASGMAWRSLLRGVGSPLNLHDAVRVFFTGQIGKYIPGSVWAYVAHARLGREHGVPASRTTAASVMFVVAHTATGAVVTATVLPLAGSGVFERFGWVALLAPLFLACLHPRLVLPVLRFVHRVLRRGTPPEHISASAIGFSLGWLTVTWLGYGLSMYLLLHPVARSDSETVLTLFSLGGFALAWTIGFLAAGVLVVTPAGLGVREVVLLTVLAPVAGPGAAAAVVLLSRVLHTVSDGVWALVGVSLRAPTPGDTTDDDPTGNAPDYADPARPVSR